MSDPKDFNFCPYGKLCPNVKEIKQLKKDLELSLDKFQVIADKYLNLKQKLEQIEELVESGYFDIAEYNGDLEYEGENHEKTTKLYQILDSQ